MPSSRSTDMLEVRTQRMREDAPAKIVMTS
jgi:hypothetical protein